VHDCSVVTAPVFDANSMILDILTNSICMQESNFAPGHDVFNGDVDENHDKNKRYSEIHTGNAWLPARDKLCNPNNNGDNMPVGLFFFGDKSHTDLHGALALTPIIFTLTMFNRALSYGKNKADRTMTSNKIQDKHNCLSIVFRSLREVHRNGGFTMTVMGREVKVKVWIHFFIGDTEGNYKWLGHYPGNRKEIYCLYRGCKCEYDQLSNINPQYVYTTLKDMQLAKRI
jgi:hypothetical protein